LFGNCVVVNGVKLKDWIAHFMGGPSLDPIGSRWLQVWGLDLKRFAEDREARNEASYRPTRLNTRSVATSLEPTEFLSQFWSLCEPSSSSRFEKLDRYLLRLTLEDVFLGVSGKKVEHDPATFRSNVSAMLSQVVASTLGLSEWLDFLTRRIDPNDPIVLEEARKTDRLDHPRHHLQVISRAFLLLRISTGACSILLKEAGVSKPDLRFWWSEFGENRGLWETSGEPAEFIDMWSDIDEAIDSLRTLRESVAVADRTSVRWYRDRSYPISVLGGCERIALWGLGL